MVQFGVKPLDYRAVPQGVTVRQGDLKKRIQFVLKLSAVTAWDIVFATHRNLLRRSKLKQIYGSFDTEVRPQITWN